MSAFYRYNPGGAGISDTLKKTWKLHLCQCFVSLGTDIVCFVCLGADISGILNKLEA